MSGKVMVLDTETSGFPPKAQPHCTRAWSRCRMLEVAWRVYLEDGTIESEASFLIKPTFKKEVPWGARAVHGLTRDELMKKGHPIALVLECLLSSLNGVSVIVGHNIAFDIKVVLAEIHRQKHEKLILHFPTVRTHCTMTMATALTVNRRFAKLGELYKQLFGEPPAGVLHRAMADVAATARIYFHIRTTLVPQ